MMFDKSRIASAEFYQRRFHNFATVSVLPATLLGIVFFCFLFVAKLEITVRTVAELIPSSSPVSVQSNTNAQIVSNKLVEGKYVSKGETLIVYHDVQTPMERRTLEDQTDTIKGKLRSLKVLKSSVEEKQSQFTGNDAYGYKQIFDDYMAQNAIYQLEAQQIKAQQSTDSFKKEETSKALQSQISKANNLEADYQTLYSAIKSGGSYPAKGVHEGMFNSYQATVSGMTGKDRQKIVADYEQQIQAQVETIQSNLDELKLQQAQVVQGDTSSIQLNEITEKQQSLQAGEIKSISFQQVDLQQTLTTLAAKQTEARDAEKDDNIKASRSGILHVDDGVLGRQRIAGGTELAQIMPKITAQEHAKISLFVSPEDITSVHRGQHVRFKLIRNIPVPIILDATVTSIDVGPTVTKTGNQFKVTATFTLTNKQAKQLHYGMEGQASIITGKKTYWKYITSEMFAH